jgi:hypothetical protein
MESYARKINMVFSHKIYKLVCPYGDIRYHSEVLMLVSDSCFKAFRNAFLLRAIFLLSNFSFRCFALLS